MLLDKKTYDECNELLKKHKHIELERRMNQLNDALIVTYVQDYLDDNQERIKQDLKNSNRYKKIFLNAVEDNFSYQVGVFNTILSIFELLLYKKSNKEIFTKKIKSLISKKNAYKVLLYLYKNPDSQHKIVSKGTGLKANYLSEILRELEDAECVDRYAVGKRSFFTLSNKAHNYMREEDVKRVNNLHKSKYSEYLKYEIELNERIFVTSKDKYNQLRIEKMMVQ